MNYGKLTAGTTKTAIDTAKPSEKGEIITYLSRMGDVLHDVQKRSEVVVLRGGAVHIVVDSYETNALLREKNLRVIADLQVISAKTTKVFYNQDFHMTCFDFFQQGGKAGTVEIRTRITIVIKMANVSQPFLTGIFFEVFFLILDGV